MMLLFRNSVPLLPRVSAKPGAKGCGGLTPTEMAFVWVTGKNDRQSVGS